MRRNVKSVLKLAALFIITVLLTIFLYKSMHMIHNLEEPEHEKLESVQNGAFFMNDNNIKAKKKIDWHDYVKIEEDKNRVGVGEQGTQGKIDESEHGKQDKLFKQNGFNAVLSDKIALNRSLPDIRHKDCLKKKYWSDLPNVSVVVPFYNEHWSTLLRTAYSVINRSPEHLLVEIILVDDHSTKGIYSSIISLTKIY